MSKYQEQLVEYIKDHPTFIQPEFRRQDILIRLQEPLRDLSISRNTFSHGITLPNDTTHVMYVWFDALSNYLSGIGLHTDSENACFWPANVHIIGKDILWFHAVIWPCMLLSMKLELPKMIFGHGFVNAADGRKMSKSVGNVVDPYDMLAKYELDTLRYFIVREASYGSDMPFSEEDLVNIHNSELCNTLGNLVSRAQVLCHKYTNSCIPNVIAEEIFNLDELRNKTEMAMTSMGLQDAVILAMAAVRDINKYVTDAAPWDVKKSDRSRQQVIVKSVLEGVYIAAHFLAPYIPSTCESIFKKLNMSPTTIFALRSVDNLPIGNEIEAMSENKDENYLFTRLVSEADKKAAEEKLVSQTKSKLNSVSKLKKEDVPLFAAMDIRVGQITKVWDHPCSDKLFCEEIDIGETEVKPIASGLRAFYSLEDLQDRKVLVICNLKPAKLGGFKSHGMVLCASNEDHTIVEFIDPPMDAIVGERVFIANESGDAVSAGQMKKQKIWEKACVDLKTSSSNVAMYKDQVVMTSKGPCTAVSLSNASIA